MTPKKRLNVILGAISSNQSTLGANQGRRNSGRAGSAVKKLRAIMVVVWVKFLPRRICSGVATHWILWINPGAARCWRVAKCH